MKTLVACIGNIFQGDDAFGCEVARVLQLKASIPGMQVVDFGIRGLDLAYALMDAPELTILVDSVSRGGEPGTLYTIEPDLEDMDDGGAQMVEAHGMDPLQVLRLAKSMGGKLGRILVVGCEAADLGGEEGRMGLTPPVAAAVAAAADMVVSLARKQFVEV